MISVIIPTTNRDLGVETASKLLKSHGKQIDNVVVVVDGSLENRVEYVSDISGSIVLVFIMGLNGSYVARNKGVGFASGKTLMFVDDGVDVLCECLPSIDSGKAITGIVKYRTKPVDSYQKWYERNAFDMERFVNDLKFIPTIFLMVDKKDFESVNGFDENFKSSGDVDFSARLVSSGISLVIAKDVEIITDLRSKKAIFRKIKRQVSGQLYFSYKNNRKGFYFYNMARVLSNIFVVSGSDFSLGFGYFWANATICWYKAYCLMSGIFLSKEGLLNLMSESNSKEVGKV